MRNAALELAAHGRSMLISPQGNGAARHEQTTWVGVFALYESTVASGAGGAKFGTCSA